MSEKLRRGVVRLIDWLLPVGTVRAFVSDIDPNKIYSSQTWVRFADERVLMGTANNMKIDTTVEAGLPNITGSARPCIRDCGYPLLVDSTGGSFYNDKGGGGYGTGNTSTNTNPNYRGVGLGFDASRSNIIYGSSETVQPPAHYVYYWKRIA